MTSNETHLIRLKTGEKLGPIVYDRRIKHVVRQHEDGNGITILTRISDEPTMTEYIEGSTGEIIMRLCDMFSVHFIDSSGKHTHRGDYPLPVNSNGKV